MEKVLFGVIGMLLFSISSIGVYEAVQHPVETIALVPEAVSTVTGALNDTVEGVAQSVSTAFASAPATSVTNDSSSTETGVSAAQNVSRRESDDEEEEDDDARTPSKTTKTNVTTKPVSVPIAAPASSAPQGSAGMFTMSQVAVHNSAASCYSAINGSVYDLTSFVKQHPGGQAAIKSLCGVDGTSAYNGQHGGQNRPTNELAPLKIGVLAS